MFQPVRDHEINGKCYRANGEDGLRFAMAGTYSVWAKAMDRRALRQGQGQGQGRSTLEAVTDE